MTEWIKVDTNEINKEVPKDIHGVSVKVTFSPYDVPRQWRGYREPNSKFFVIEFQYLLDEATRTEKPAKELPIELEIGENSKRIYKIRMDVVKMGCEGKPVRLEIESLDLARNVVDAIKQFSTTVPPKLRERYKMPENLVFNKRDEIFSGVAG
jgi:hypothetical protein